MMATTDETYNGWHNYETWAAALWIDNEEPTYRERCALADHAASIGALAETLKTWVTDELMPDLGASLAADLLGAALSEVDWSEIASNWYEEAHS
jgi:hypothetical protein